jgi:hypothetical protein
MFSEHPYDILWLCYHSMIIKYHSWRNTHAKRTTMYPLPVQDAFARWHMDILAGLPKTKDGYQYILLLIDSFSHWCECFPLTSQDAVNVARVLYNAIFTRFGMPASILSDRGQNCMSFCMCVSFYYLTCFTRCNIIVNMLIYSWPTLFLSNSFICFLNTHITSCSYAIMVW